MQRWLVKFAPFRYSWADCLRHVRFQLYGVRSAQAHNALARMEVGEEVLFYHSQQERAVMGLLRVATPAHPDPTAPDGSGWLSVTFEPERTLAVPVSLARLRQESALGSISLLRQPQLAVMPLTEAEFDLILQLSEIA